MNKKEKIYDISIDTYALANVLEVVRYYLDNAADDYKNTVKTPETLRMCDVGGNASSVLSLVQEKLDCLSDELDSVYEEMGEEENAEGNAA